MALRCLIVDDNRRFLEVARETLARDGIEVVATVTTGADALREADKFRPDIVLVDIGLKGESGFAVTTQLVERNPWLHSRIVLISTRSEDDYAELIETSPALGFLAKSELSADAVRRLLAAEAA